MYGVDLREYEYRLSRKSHDVVYAGCYIFPVLLLLYFMLRNRRDEIMAGSAEQMFYELGFFLFLAVFVYAAVYWSFHCYWFIKDVPDPKSRRFGRLKETSRHFLEQYQVSEPLGKYFDECGSDLVLETAFYFKSNFLTSKNFSKLLELSVDRLRLDRELKEKLIASDLRTVGDLLFLYHVDIDKVPLTEDEIYMVNIAMNRYSRPLKVGGLFIHLLTRLGELEQYNKEHEKN